MYTNRKLGFFETLAGLVTQPGETALELLGAQHPPHVLRIFVLLLAVLFGPVVYQLYRAPNVIYRPEIAFSILFVFSFTVLFFIFSEAVLLKLCGVEFRLEQLVAAVTYSFVPFIAFFLVMHGLSFFMHGNFSFVDYLFHGEFPFEESIVRLIPFVWILMQLISLLIFFFSMRALGEISIFSSFLLAVIALLPLYGSFILGIYLAEVAVPGSFSRLVIFAAV